LTASSCLCKSKQKQAKASKSKQKQAKASKSKQKQAEETSKTVNPYNLTNVQALHTRTATSYKYNSL